MKVYFQKKQHLGGDLWMFFFRPERHLRYVAGQFVEITLPITSLDERGAKRWFTLCSSPTEDFLSITTRINSSRPSTFKAHLSSLKPNDKIGMTEAMGDFVLPKDPSINLVFLAAGIGVTPYRSIVKSLVDTNEQRSIEFIFAAARETDFVFSEIFSDYGLTPQKLLGKHLSVRYLQQSVNHLEDKLLYISGPEPMVETFVKEATATKLKTAGLVTDYFHNYESY